MPTPIIDLLTKNRPILGALLKGGKAAIASRLKDNTDMPTETAAAVTAMDAAPVLTDIAENPNVALVAVKSGWLSRINWTQVAGPIASGFAIIGLNLTPEQIVAVVTGIQVIQSVITWVLRTWFNHTVTPAAADRAVSQGKAV